MGSGNIANRVAPSAICRQPASDASSPSLNTPPSHALICHPVLSAVTLHVLHVGGGHSNIMCAASSAACKCGGGGCCRFTY